MATIGVHYVRASLAGAARGGLSAADLLKQAGINPETLAFPGSRVDVGIMARLIQAIWSRTRDEFMGFTASPCANGVFALMCDQVKHSMNLEEMLHTGVRFYNLFTRDISMELTAEEDLLTQTFRFSQPELDPEHFYLEFWMSIWHRFCSWYIGEPIRLREVHLDFPEPEYLDELRFVFPCVLKFDQPDNRLVFDREYGIKPLVRTEADLRNFLWEAPLALMTIPGGDQLFSARIKRLLEAASETDIPSMQSTARSLSITPQTLNNRLKKEGLSFQRLKDDILRDRAIRLLLGSQHSVEEIAAELGYREARSFTRAFRRWTGSSPTGFRRIQSIGSSRLTPG